MPDDALALPLLHALLRGEVRPGESFAVFYDGDADWSRLASALLAGLARAGRDTLLVVTSRPVEEVRTEIGASGAPLDAWEKEERVVLSDGFTHKTGRPSTERVHFRSFNPADLSIAAEEAASAWPRGSARIFENLSDVVCASDERTFLRFHQVWHARMVAAGRIPFDAFVRGVHTDALYASVAAAATCTMELRKAEVDGRLEDVLRIRGFKGRRPDTRPHVVAVSPTLDVRLTPALGAPVP